MAKRMHGVAGIGIIISLALPMNAASGEVPIPSTPAEINTPKPEIDLNRLNCLDRCMKDYFRSKVCNLPSTCEEDFQGCRNNLLGYKHYTCDKERSACLKQVDKAIKECKEKAAKDNLKCQKACYQDAAPKK